MIEVKISETRITVDGHAGYADSGKDIICAAVSILTQNLIKSIEDLTNDSISYSMVSGHVDIKYKNLSERGRLLVDSFFIGICGIANTYGEKYVQIESSAGRAKNRKRKRGYYEVHEC